MLKLSCHLDRGLAVQLERTLAQQKMLEWVLDVSSHWGARLVGYFEDAPSAKRAFVELRTLLPALPEHPELRELPAEAWQKSYRDHFQAVQVGSFLLAPAWGPPPEAAAGSIVLELDPGLSFGTDHPTTRLCLSALEQFASSRPDGLSQQRVLDAGSGSGVLGIAAIKLGFGSGKAFDLDAVAVSATKQNAARNGVLPRLSCEQLDLHSGLAESADLVFANIHHNVLVAHSTALLAAVKANGLLVLSGCLQSDTLELRAAFESAITQRAWPLARLHTVNCDGWGAVCIARRPEA